MSEKYKELEEILIGRAEAQAIASGEVEKYKNSLIEVTSELEALSLKAAHLQEENQNSQALKGNYEALKSEHETLEDSYECLKDDYDK